MLEKFLADGDFRGRVYLRRNFFVGFRDGVSFVYFGEYPAWRVNR